MNVLEMRGKPILESEDDPIRNSASQESGSSRIWLYVMLEGGLALIGIALAWAAGINAIGRPSGAEELAFFTPLLWGVGVGLGFFVVMFGLDKLSFSPLARLRELVERAMAQLLAGANLWQIAALAAAAGIGEEVLFRGFLQQGVADAMKRMEFDPLVCQIAAIGLASLIFGLCHALTKTYLVAATVIGALLGYLYVYTDNLLAPIVAHGVYDFVAILYFVRSSRKSR
jgi:uncharacterized protein